MNKWMMTAGLAALLALTGCPEDENNGTGDMGLTDNDMASNNDTDMGGTNNDDMTDNLLLYIAKLESTTTGDEACAVADPGPDIFGIGLEDGLGEQLGWGIPVWDEIQQDGNDHSDTSLFDGNALDIGADACPDMFDGNVVSLGCEESGDMAGPRWIAFEFVDGDGNRIALDAMADQFIRVYEWGGQCTTGTIDDTYTLSLCRDTAAITAGDDSSCDITLVVDAAGETPGEVAGF